MKRLLMTVAACALLTTTAQAYEVTCGAPQVLFGDDVRDNNPVVSVEVNYEPDDHAWRIFHNLRNGLVVSRSEQYAITDASTDTVAQWQGSHGRQRHLYMVGEVRRENGGIYYHEWQYNRNTNSMLFQSKTQCRPIAVAPLVMQSDRPLPSQPLPSQRQQVASVLYFQVPSDVSAGKLNIRSGPGTNYDLLGAIPAGAQVTATRCVPREDGINGADWCLVTWRGLSGWASRVGLMPTS
jgi:Bacterial SH3 domain